MGRSITSLPDLFPVLPVLVGVSLLLAAGQLAAVAEHALLERPLQVVDAALHVRLELVQLAAQLDDLLDARQVHAQLLGEPPYFTQVLNVPLRVEPRLAGTAAGFDEALPFVEAQGLGVHVNELGRNADHVKIGRASCRERGERTAWKSA